MPNLKFLRFYYRYGDESDKLYLPQGLNYLSQKLKILEWDHFPLTCMPSNFCTEYLVELNMRFSKLHKLWEGNRVRNCYRVLFNFQLFLLKFICIDI